MTNGEKYKNEILRCDDVCEFLNKNVLVPNGMECHNGVTSCGKCELLAAIWLSEQYIEPPICWEDVAIDTPILVNDTETDGWVRRHFAAYKDGMVYAWENGCTSFTSTVFVPWAHAKLVREEKR